MHASFVRRGNHGLHSARDMRHRLLDQHMLAGFGCTACVRGVKLVRRRHVHDLYARLGAKCFDSVVGLAQNSAANKARASGLGSAAATSAIRGSRVNVGSITVNARPSPATPRLGDFRVAPLAWYAASSVLILDI